MGRSANWVAGLSLLSVLLGACVDDKDVWTPLAEGKADGNTVDKGRIAFGDAVEETLGLANRHAYAFTVRAGAEIQVDMEALEAGLDAYLIVVSPGGETLVEPGWDDGGEGRNARIEGLELPVAGTYQLLAMSYRDLSEGRYALRLTCAVDPCVEASEPEFADLVNRTAQHAAYEMEIPEPHDYTIDPTRLNPVHEEEFNDLVMPELAHLAFYSVEERMWVEVAFDYIKNYCFARRRAVDAYLWFGEELEAVYEEQSDFEGRTVRKYLLPGFTRASFSSESWVETARIKVIGQLRVGTTNWNNHEAVVVNTENGVRVIDPSFDQSMILTLEDWFAYFAPEVTDKTCESVSPDMLREINTQLILTQQFGQPWNESIPHCGYLFGQRLDAVDMTTYTAYFFGTVVEKFLSAMLWKSFEEDLVKASHGY